MSRLVRAWRELGPEQRLAAVAAVALLLTMFLPWYQQNAVDRAGLVSQDLDAFAAFSFLEATILLVALAVLALLFARAEGHSAAMPGGDGTIVLAGGAWTALVLFYRLFDKPGVESHGIAADVGVQWGIFFALAAAGLLAYAGTRMRAIRPLPPLIASARARARGAWSEPRRAHENGWPRESPQAEDEVTVLAPAAPARPSGAVPLPKQPRLGRGSSSGAPARTAPPRASTQQLSFDDDQPAPGKEPPAEPV